MDQDAANIPNPESPRELPGWARALVALDRAARRTHRGFELVRDELLIGFLPPDLYDTFTDSAYRQQPSLLPGGDLHGLGLFPWELELIGSPPFPLSGRILLGGAGGGRELPELLSAGYEVLAFEPNPVLLRGALQTAGDNPGARIVQAGFGDLVRAVERGTGPLAEARSVPFDAVILGWGSLTHLVRAEDRLALLRSLRELAPKAPVILSFFMRSTDPEAGRGSRLARRLIRGLAARMGRPLPQAGLHFGHLGFSHRFSKEEVHELALASGYQVHLLDERQFPHALFVPASARPPRPCATEEKRRGSA